jgi:putative restriction endonuclease
MDRDELRARIADLSVWACGSERAPHKPLLLLWALGRCAAGEQRLVSYAEVDDAVRPLLEEFGPPRKSYHTEYPFWYLRNDGLWEVVGVAEAKVREGKATQPTKRELLRVGAAGGLVPDVYALVRSEPRLLYEIANQLVDAHFPDTIRADILGAVGLDELELGFRRRRDPGFRAAVLVAYGYRCAVCGFDARLGNTLLAIEAAHIQWHHAGGPDRVTNGLGVCSLHHKLFDRGAFTLASSCVVVVSQLVNGGKATEEALLRFHGKAIILPRTPSARPGEAFIEWHRSEVFKGELASG